MLCASFGHILPRAGCKGIPHHQALLPFPNLLLRIPLASSLTQYIYAIVKTLLATSIPISLSLIPRFIKSENVFFYAYIYNIAHSLKNKIKLGIYIYMYIIFSSLARLRSFRRTPADSKNSWGILPSPSFQATPKRTLFLRPTVHGPSCTHSFFPLFTTVFATSRALPFPLKYDKCEMF